MIDPFFPNYIFTVLTLPPGQLAFKRYGYISQYSSRHLSSRYPAHYGVHPCTMSNTTCENIPLNTSPIGAKQITTQSSLKMEKSGVGVCLRSRALMSVVAHAVCVASFLERADYTCSLATLWEPGFGSHTNMASLLIEAQRRDCRGH